MNLKCICSGSSGNAYILEADNQKLILDFGCSVKELKKMLNFDLTNIVGGLCTHIHSDHYASVRDFKNMGFIVWCPFESVEKRHMRLGDYDIYAFPLPHDGTECYGYLIKYGDEKLLYMTDFEYCEYTFKSQEVNYMLIECNHDMELVDKDLPYYEHSLRGHADISVTEEFIRTNMSDRLTNVIICHISETSGDANNFKKRIGAIGDFKLDIAHKSLIVNLVDKNKCPF